MSRPRVKWVTRIVGLVIVLAVSGGLWIAHGRGWLTPVWEWMRPSTATSERNRHEGGSMGEMAGMDMGAMPEASSSPGVKGYAEVDVAPEVQQRIGVTLGRVERAPLRMNVRTVGIVRPDETRTFHIHVRSEGWVEKLFVNYTGQRVEKGAPFLSIYSPEFYRTQLDYVTGRRAERAAGSLMRTEKSLADLAVIKLHLLDISGPELEELERSGKPQEFMTLRSPATGTVLEKSVLEHEYITPQRDLYVVADLSTVWVQAKVYEYELPHIGLGQPATVTVPSLPERQFTGKVVFIQPTVEETTRTIQVRVELPNPEGSLKPAMFADIEIEHEMGEGLLVPMSAVIRTGRREMAFRARSDNRLVPVEIRIGAVKFGDRFQVLEGLAEGDRVVTSANFLIDSESRLKEGAGGMAGMPGMDMGGTKSMKHSQMNH